MSAADDFIQALKSNDDLREDLNVAFHKLFVAAQIVGLSKNDKLDCVEALKDYIVYDQNYNNVHVYWSV